MDYDETSVLPRRNRNRRGRNNRATAEQTEDQSNSQKVDPIIRDDPVDPAA